MSSQNQLIEKASPRYQLGCGVVCKQQKLILHYREACYDLSALLQDSQVKKELSLESFRNPQSLLQMVYEWSFWGTKVPQVVELVLESQQLDILPAELDRTAIRWLSPLTYPRKLICIGANYLDHLTEMGVKELPHYPYSFLKPATTTLVGAGTLVSLPEQAKMVDWEVELAVIIGRKTHLVRGEEAMACVAGYSVLNDLSARDWIEESPPIGVDWVMQKGFDGFTPMGPFFTPAEFVSNPQNLSLTLSVNGEVKQDSNTANMIFSVQEVVEHLSAIMTLEPGDVIATGTPAGVGYAKKPREFLKPADHVKAEIEGLGVLETPIG